MNKIRQAFENGKAFIPFITCGDPDVETTMACVREMVKSGADLIELGIPFSDPTAEGPVIQGANLRALTGGISTCAGIGIDGLILPDLPFEEKEEFLAVCRAHGVALISLIAPTSANRVAMIAKEAEGFIYLVSSLGVTGVRSSITTDLGPIIRTIRENTDVPCAVGFGISNPEQAKTMAKEADGVIVGSAIVKLIAQYGKDAAAPVGAFVKEMKDAVR